MGAKAPTKLKLRRPTFKCDECSQKFLSAQTLKSHKICAHRSKPKPKKNSKMENSTVKSAKPLILSAKPLALTSKSLPPTAKSLTSTAKSLTPTAKSLTPTAKSLKPTAKPLAPTAKVMPSLKPKKVVIDIPYSPDVGKTLYECPVCERQFTLYFSAYKHIVQKHQNNTKDNQELAGNSSEVIEPVGIETCLSCNIQVRTNELHHCMNLSRDLKTMGLMCKCLGCGQIFPSVIMFDMHVSGLHSDSVETMFFPNTHEFTVWREHMEEQTGIEYMIMCRSGYKQTYHCSHVFPVGEDRITVFCPSSIIVRQYSKSIQVHFYKQHYGHECDYKLPDEFKKYLGTEIITKSGLEMTESSKEEEDLYPRFKSVIDSIIVSAYKTDKETLKLLYFKALEMSQMIPKEEVVKPQVKPMTDKQITQALEFIGDMPKIVKTESIADRVEVKPTNFKKACFNDSYKEFVSKTIKETELSNSVEASKINHTLYKRKRRVMKAYGKKEVVKTKIGQFKPPTPPKKVINLIEVKAPKCIETVKSPLKEIKEAKQLDVSRQCIDINYEVIEQENDCNILVLKI